MTEHSLSETVWIGWMCLFGAFIILVMCSGYMVHSDISTILQSTNSQHTFSYAETVLMLFASVGGIAAILSLLHGHIIHAFMMLIMSGIVASTLLAHGYADTSQAQSIVNWLNDSKEIDPHFSAWIVGWGSLWAYGRYFYNCFKYPMFGFRKWKDGFLRNNSVWITIFSIITLYAVIKKILK